MLRLTYLIRNQDHLRMNIAPDINNHLRSKDITRSMIIKNKSSQVCDYPPPLPSSSNSILGLKYTFAQVSQTYAKLLIRDKMYFGRLFQTTAELFSKFQNLCLIAYILRLRGIKFFQLIFATSIEENNTSSRRKESAPFTLDQEYPTAPNNSGRLP